MCARGGEGRDTGATNYAGYGKPLASGLGRALRALVLGGGTSPTTGLGNREPLAPKSRYARFDNVIGVPWAPSATPRALFRQSAYSGDFPLEEQPQLTKVRPWLDSYRGNP